MSVTYLQFIWCCLKFHFLFTPEYTPWTRTSILRPFARTRRLLLLQSIFTMKATCRKFENSIMLTLDTPERRAVGRSSLRKGCPEPWKRKAGSRINWTMKVQSRATYFQSQCSPMMTKSSSLGSHQPSRYENRLAHGPAQKPFREVMDSMKYGVTFVWSQASVWKIVELPQPAELELDYGDSLSFCVIFMGPARSEPIWTDNAFRHYCWPL